ncbi:MAG: TlpA family protein disulfide reductase, partial [Rhodococcus sp.]|nr:TlpA family protein disulfide reductase [Rhodococcus sp. (in: high G+C Gram-positive bacteria)]
MSSAARWSLAALLVVVALVVAMWPRAETDEAGSGQRGGATSSNEQSSVDDAELAGLRTDAGLADCPQPEEGSVSGAALAGVSVSCLADVSSVDLASALA